MKSRKPIAVLVIIWLLLAFGVVHPLFAQQVYGKPNIWFTWQNSYQFHQKWFLETELHARFDNYLEQPEQLIFRPSIKYKHGESIHFAAGYSYIHTFPYGSFPLKAERPEHNIWQQVTFLQKIKTLQFFHRLRLEERFQSNWQESQNRYTFQQVEYRTRFRYRFGVKIPLSRKWFLQVFDELWIRTGATLGTINFDRNWLSVGAGYKINPHLKISLSYLHQYIRHNDTLFEQHSTAQLTLATTMGTEKKAAVPK